MFTATRRFTVRMAIPALALLCLNGIAASAVTYRQQPESRPALSEPDDEGNALENAFSRRAGKTLHLFGYEVFASAGTASPPAFGTAQNDYLLGPGDEVRVTIRGGKYDNSRRYTVNSNGDVIIDRNLHQVRLRELQHRGADDRRQRQPRLQPVRPQVAEQTPHQPGVVSFAEYFFVVHSVFFAIDR